MNTRLHRRGERTDAKFVAEGDLVVMRALEVGHVPELIICDEAALPTLEGIGDHLSTATVVTADEATRKAATGLGVALPIVALFPKPPLVDHSELIARNDRIIILSQVDNPTNVGAIVRSAAAFGFTGLVLDGESSDPFARRALRVAMGTTFQLDIARTGDAEELFATLRSAGFDSYAMTPASDAVDLSGVKAGRRVALVLGSERDGLSDDWMRLAGHRVRIPMAAGVDSLNVAAAAAVACYGLTRRNG
ncbi:MAG: RNA methyltransferase [Acidobacteria bacterium]|nr:RNA methyltransferase [Acidobacteriota bacterium]